MTNTFVTRTEVMSLPRDRRKLERLLQRALRGEVFMHDQNTTGNVVTMRYHEPRGHSQHMTKITQGLDVLLLMLGCEYLALHKFWFDITDTDDSAYTRLRKAAGSHVTKVSREEWDSGIIGTQLSVFHPLKRRLEWAARRIGRDDIGSEIAFRRLFGLRATKRLRRDIARELIPGVVRRVTAMFDLLDQRGPLAFKFVHPLQAADRTKNAKLEGSAFIREKLREASFKKNVIKPVVLSDDEVACRAREPRRRSHRTRGRTRADHR